MNHKQLTFAREFRGYSQTELSNQIQGLSQSNLSKFEKGLGVLSEEIQKTIIDFLDFPEDFYNRKINSVIENANYRKRATVSKSKILKFENKCKIIGYVVDELSESIEWPDFILAPLNVEDGFSPEYIANYTRRLIKLSIDEPVKDIFSILESSGIILYEINEDEKFDGVSFITDKGYPVIIVNKNFSNDRKRFTIAHELGHILMHNENNFPISSFREKEKEANQFASEFLMPENSIKNSLRNLRLNELGNFKNYWLTSMSSIIRRAKDLKCIDDYKYKYFLIEMSRNGFTKKEPIEVYIDKPTCLKNAINIFKNELGYSFEDFSKYTALPNDIIEVIFNSDNIIKLKIV
ncbi:XRE family transcriptional regulator [Epilithonimonas sp.]|uniref:helix-turn-helix domain-containing protein n=1 Tax=Epilithonimonas sp. TaxID=2894511 RepID=UPI0028A1D2BB|nr:XRE family transcriptional regulator [Epilithonimonas sp.]